MPDARNHIQMHTFPHHIRGARRLTCIAVALLWTTACDEDTGDDESIAECSCTGVTEEGEVEHYDREMVFPYEPPDLDFAWRAAYGEFCYENPPGTWVGYLYPECECTCVGLKVQ